MPSSWYRFEPLTDVWEDPTPADERRGRYTFKATFSNTIDLLEREIRMLDPDRPWDATAVVLQVACSPSDVRRDGGLRADARAFGHPGVRITFETEQHGQLTYATDVCELWQHNVRSLALGLEALRAVNRHGIAKRGQQYTGFKALGAGRAMPASHMTSDQARTALVAAAYGSSPDPAIAVEITRNSDSLRSTYRRARAMSHPDRHAGDRAAWDQVEQAGAVLGLLS